MSETIVAASVQMEPRIGEPARNIAHSIALMESAADRGAGLIVLPELANSGYVFASRAEAFALAEDPYTGPASVAWPACANAQARRSTTARW
jgi:N-carbamoylputrescine amidase